LENKRKPVDWLEDVWNVPLKADIGLTPAERRILALLKNREGRPVPPDIITRELDLDPAADGGAARGITS
jgi:hypothetical protein